MNTNASRFSLLKAIGLFLGATFFAYLFSITLHETGHYLANILLGVPQRGIVLNPFGANYNIYLGDLSVALGTPGRRVFSGLSGPLFDLLVTVTISLLLWRKRSPGLLLLLTLGSIALIHESVNIIMSIIDGYGDWAEVSANNVPPVILSLLAVLLLVAGCIWMLQLLPLVGVTPGDPFWRKLVVVLAGMPLLNLCAVAYLTLFGTDVYVPTFGGAMLRDGLRLDKTIFLAASTILSVIVIAFHTPLFPWLDRLSHTPTAQVTWRDTLISLGLAVAIIFIQLVFFQDPGAMTI
jgi:hypothetical protein